MQDPETKERVACWVLRDVHALGDYRSARGAIEAGLARAGTEIVVREGSNQFGLYESSVKTKANGGEGLLRFNSYMHPANSHERETFQAVENEVTDAVVAKLIAENHLDVAMRVVSTIIPVYLLDGERGQAAAHGV